MSKTTLARRICAVALFVLDIVFLILCLTQTNTPFWTYIFVGLFGALAVAVFFINTNVSKNSDNSIEKATMGDLVGVFTIEANENLSILYCNDTFATIHGYKSVSELMNKTQGIGANLLKADSLTSVQDYIVTAIAEDKKYLEKDVEIQLPSANSGSQEFNKVFVWGKLRRHNGAWVVDGCVADLTNQHQFHRDLELLNDTLTAATSMLSSMVFLINIPEKSLLNLSGSRFSGEFYNYIEDFPTVLAGVHSIHQDDKENLLNAVDNLMKGKKEADLVIRIYSQNGNLHYMHLKTRTVYGHEGQPVRAVAILEDVTDSKLKEESLLERAEIDPLTKIYNRQTVVELISEALVSDNGAFLFLDLDEFKTYNDTYGHQKGDDRIADIATAMKDSVRKNDLVGRLAGDEFTIFLRGTTDEKEITGIAEKISENVKKLNVQDGLVSVTISIGIAISPQHGNSFESLYSCADKALYASKSLGKNTISFYKII